MTYFENEAAWGIIARIEIREWAYFAMAILDVLTRMAAF